MVTPMIRNEDGHCTLYKFISLIKYLNSPQMRNFLELRDGDRMMRIKWKENGDSLKRSIRIESNPMV